MRERAASRAAFSFSGVETSGTGAPSFTTTPTPTRASATRLVGARLPALSWMSIAGTERMMASNVFSASSLYDVERRSDGEGHLIAGQLFEVSGDRFRRDLRRADGEHAHLGGSGEGGLRR